MPLRYKWNKFIINTKEDLLKCIRHIKSIKVELAGFDTETTGLHIIKDVPFLLIFGYTDSKEGYVYLVDKRKDETLFNDTVYSIKHLLKDVEVVAHNTKFDLHMMHNVGYPKLFSKVTDSMIYIRLALDALTESAGVSLGLKPFASKHLDPGAREHERELKDYLKSIKAKRTLKLLTLLKDTPLPEELKITGRERTWTNPIIEKLVDDKIEGDLKTPEEVKVIVSSVLNDVELDPKRYDNVPEQILYKYAHYDVVYSIETVLLLRDEIKNKSQETTLKLENDLIIPLYNMERVGFSFNKEYALETKTVMLNYILKQREKLKDILGADVSIGQHKTIMKIFDEKFRIEMSSTGNPILEKVLKLKAEIPTLKEAQKAVRLIMELRTLEKWYTTYLLNLIDQEYNGRVYTTIKQTGAVSGRVSSNFQQFPSKPIKDEDGNILFHARRLIKTTGGDFPAIFYLDFSQIELRVQAIYTILVGDPDKNFCRAYMPYQCYRLDHEGEPHFFDMNNEEDQKTFRNFEWLQSEDNVVWHDVDLHSATTLLAFPNIDKGAPDFGTYRKMGKMTNFACNYGASAKAVAEQLDVEMSVASKLVNAYKKAFPGVFSYRKYVDNFINAYGHAQNLFGRRYYNVSPHNAYNYLVQGSSADFLKMKIIEIHNYIKEKKYKSKFQMNIHDELSFELHKDDPISIILEIKSIMESLPNSPIPIVSDPEITYTTWDEKYDYE